MKPSRLFVATAALLLLIAFGAGLYVWQRQQNEEKMAQAQAAAVEKLLATSFAPPTGSPITLSTWRGQPVVVNFWATWCQPCLKEMPLFSRLQDKYPKVRFVGIAVDSAENVEAFSAAHKVSYPLLVGSGDSVLLMAALGNQRNGLPFTISLDAEGHVRHAKLGALTEAEVERIVAELGGS